MYSDVQLPQAKQWLLVSVAVSILGKLTTVHMVRYRAELLTFSEILGSRAL